MYESNNLLGKKLWIAYRVSHTIAKKIALAKQERMQLARLQLICKNDYTRS